MKTNAVNRKRAVVAATACLVASLAYEVAYLIILRAEVARTFDITPTVVHYLVAQPVLWLAAGTLAGALASPVRTGGRRLQAVAAVLAALFVSAWLLLALASTGVAPATLVDTCIALVPPAGALAGIAGALALCGRRS